MTGETEDEDEKKTPLHIAAAAGDADWVKTLLKRGANVNAGDAGGFTPLHDAAREGHTEIVKLLLQAGADVNALATEAGDETPLMQAVRSSGNIETVKALLAHGAHVYEFAEQGMGPIHVAAAVGTPDMVTALLDAGADVNERDGGGETALHHAAHRGLAEERSREMVEMLLKAGANVNAVSAPYYRTPLQEAADAIDPSWEVMRLLLQAGANPDARDGDGRTAQDIAQANDNKLATVMLSRAIAASRRDGGRGR